jgi:hypothetical protein
MQIVLISSYSWHNETIYSHDVMVANIFLKVDVIFKIINKF